MSWRSLFAFNNPTGLIGSQYTAVSPVSSSIPIGGNATQIANFKNLPVGVYSIIGYLLVSYTIGSTIDRLNIIQDTTNSINVGGQLIIPTRTTLTEIEGQNQIVPFYNAVITITPGDTDSRVYITANDNSAALILEGITFTATKLA